MSFQILSPPPPLTNPFKERSQKQAREQVDRIAEESRIGWKGALGIAQEMFGKREGLSIGECKKLVEEIKRRRK